MHDGLITVPSLQGHNAGDCEETITGKLILWKIFCRQHDLLMMTTLPSTKRMHGGIHEMGNTKKRKMVV